MIIDSSIAVQCLVVQLAPNTYHLAWWDSGVKQLPLQLPNLFRGAADAHDPFSLI